MHANKAFENLGWFCSECLFIWPKVVVCDLPLIALYGSQSYRVGLAFESKKVQIATLFKKIYQNSSVLNAYCGRLKRLIECADERCQTQRPEVLSAFVNSEYKKFIKVTSCIGYLIPTTSSVAQAGVVVDNLAQTATLLDRLIVNLSTRDGLFSRPRSSSDLTSLTPRAPLVGPIYEEDEDQLDGSSSSQGSQVPPLGRLQLHLPSSGPRGVLAPHQGVSAPTTPIEALAKDQAFIEQINTLCQLDPMTTYYKRLVVLCQAITGLVRALFYDLPHFIVWVQTTLKQLLQQAPCIAETVDDVYRGAYDFNQLLEGLLKIEPYVGSLEELLLSEQIDFSYSAIQQGLDQLLELIGSQLPGQIQELGSQFKVVLDRANPLLEKALSTLEGRSLASVMLRSGGTATPPSNLVATPTAGDSTPAAFSSAARRPSVTSGPLPHGSGDPKPSFGAAFSTLGKGVAKLFTPPP